MKSKKDIQQLAKQIAEAELNAQKFSEQGEVESLQSQLRKIEDIIGSLSLREGLELNDAVIKILQNN